MSERPSWVADDLYPFQSRYLEVGEHRVHYLDEGEGPVHLFLAGMWSFTFRHYIAPMRASHRCVAIDYPGFGLSSAPDGFVPDLEELARVVDAVVKKLDLRDVTLWVNDAGGPIGMSVAARDPDRYRAFVIGGTFAWSLENTPKVARMLRFVGSAPFRFVNRQLNIFPRLLGGPALGTRTLSAREKLHYRMPLARKATRDRPLLLLRSFRTSAAFLRETERRLANLRAKPALFLFGENDRAIEFLDRWQRELPEHTTVILPGVDHFPFEDDPPRVLEAVTRWLPSVTGARPPRSTPGPAPARRASPG